MAMKMQLYASNSFSSFPTSLKLDFDQNMKKQMESKKFFSRKPNNTKQNSSRFVTYRLKTQQSQNFNIQPLDMNKIQQTNEKNQSPCLKFLSNKSQKSLQKLIFPSSYSMENLPLLSTINGNQKNPQMTIKQNRQEKQDKNTQKFINRTRFNTITNSLITTNKKEAPPSSQDFNDELQMILAKDLGGSTQLSSNENIHVSQFMDIEEFQNNKLRPMTLSVLSLNKNKNPPKQCPNCLTKQKTIKQLQKRNRKLKCDLIKKQTEIKQLNQRLCVIDKNLQRTKNTKINLESQIKVIKENSKIIELQKEDLQKFNQKLQSDVKKLRQDLRYKDLQVNISKIYKTKSLELEFKVETLKKQLERSKMLRNRLESSKSTQNLRINILKRNFSNISLRTTIQEKNIPQKKPNIKKVYEEDILFSLTSSSCD